MILELYTTMRAVPDQLEAKSDWPVSADVIDLCEQLGVKESE